MVILVINHSFRGDGQELLEQAHFGCQAALADIELGGKHVAIERDLIHQRLNLSYLRVEEVVLQRHEASNNLS